MKKPEQQYSFKSEDERQVAVCIAIQKIGLATIQEIKEKIEKWGGKITEKQIKKCAENLRRRDLLSIDLSEKNDTGISVERYVMKKIKLAIPEIAQIKDIIDNPDMNVLKEELDHSKKTQKKGLKTFDYYSVNATFRTKGNVQGFIPDASGVIRHYREGKEVVFYPYHFKNWMRANLPLINRSSNSVSEMNFQDGRVEFDGKEMLLKGPTCTLGLPIIDKWITNTESGFDSSRGTSGRGARKVECLPIGCRICTSFTVPREYIRPEKFELALRIMCDRGKAFGGGAKLSTGRLVLEKMEIGENAIWTED